MRVEGLEFRVQGLGFRVWGLGFRVSGLEIRVPVEVGGTVRAWYRPLHRNVLEVEWLKRQKRFPAKAENRGVVVTEAGS